MIQIFDIHGGDVDDMNLKASIKSFQDKNFEPLTLCSSWNHICSLLPACIVCLSYTSLS
jgi:hypothetical protein